MLKENVFLDHACVCCDHFIKGNSIFVDLNIWQRILFSGIIITLLQPSYLHTADLNRSDSAIT